ncbi:uncharacterized protein [Littorina saxatilis]|uniref:uncharacterized protein n=1 Tax=Littorina saxatilis TaxID=31220 RepID=UPI0038B5ECE0
MASRQSQSLSVQWREKGNEFYRKAGDDVSPTLQVNRLQQAINHYDRAIYLAELPEEKSSAHKNMAMANWKMAKATDLPKNVMFYFKGALKHFKEAKKQGADRDNTWQDSLVVSAASCWSDIHDRVDSWNFEERVRELEQLVPLSIDDFTMAYEYYGIAELYFHQSLTFLADRDYQRCLRFLANCNFAMNEAMRYGGLDNSLARKCALLRDNIHVTHCVAESIQARIRGEELLEYIIRDEEILNIDMVWEVVDCFSKAAMLTRDRDLELEAMALSDMGKVYDQVLKMRERAKTCLMKVLELANTMVPRNFTGDEWYEFARSTVERYQQLSVHLLQSWYEFARSTVERYQKEQVESEKEKAEEEALKLIKNEVDVIKKKHGDLGKLEFLKFLYTTHPPKNPEHKLGEVSPTPEQSKLKRLYQKAVIHYHPDKIQVDEHGSKWKVLTEEITKLLNGHYEFFKGCSEKLNVSSDVDCDRPEEEEKD